MAGHIPGPEVIIMYLSILRLKDVLRYREEETMTFTILFLRRLLKEAGLTMEDFNKIEKKK